MLKRLLNILVNLVILSAVIALIGGGVIAVRGYCYYKERIEYKAVSAVAGEIRSERHFTPIGELPEFYLEAVIAVEDRNFYSHSGISVKSLVRALIADIKAGAPVQGGSTITQQLAKNELFTQEKTIDRKAAEIFAAFAFERELEKDEILELYVNSIYFGNGCEGVGSACKEFFGKQPSELTEFECAMLAGIPNSPNRFSPKDNPDKAEKRAKEVLSAMLANGSITAEELSEIENSNQTEKEK